MGKRIWVVRFVLALFLLALVSAPALAYTSDQARAEFAEEYGHVSTFLGRAARVESWKTYTFTWTSLGTNVYGNYHMYWNGSASTTENDFSISNGIVSIGPLDGAILHEIGHQYFSWELGMSYINETTWYKDTLATKFAYCIAPNATDSSAELSAVRDFLVTKLGSANYTSSDCQPMWDSLGTAMDSWNGQPGLPGW